MNAQSSQQVLENRLRLKTTIVATKWLGTIDSEFIIDEFHCLKPRKVQL